MFIYYTLFSLFIFLVVISAVVGFLFHELSDKITSSKIISLLAGAAASVIASSLITKLLLSDIWNLYAAAIAVTLVLYVILVRSLNKHYK
ncbi:hypothetical protein SporoP37_11175 [Sporosarcina sp. P37]|uniref:hypothetical protein n=1 Tax=unclassified Sporosarcina TaxID=2647733 RepID=UPI0009BCA0B3|nr:MULTISPECIES: hypothetical protein [unclassified Sporosarcina]ARD48655.1 hypothetical protein SporoP33_10765 [Sporosarcina sp. P33]ARK25160.1 hypothetical protein SporoP37_11175 [Sporosarcina sp. P37]PID16254.1 hypothetical protein CSV62_15750 [Sporosarcina sp. P35]